jgi:hypothetical protein
LRVAGEALLDLLGGPVALVGEPVGLLGELADDPAGGVLGRDGDGLGRERGLDLVDQPGAQPWGVALREWIEPARPRGAQRGRRRIAGKQCPGYGMVEPGAEHPLQRRPDRQQHVAQAVRVPGEVVVAAQHPQPLEWLVGALSHGSETA